MTSFSTASSVVRPRIACIGECMVELSPAEQGLFKQAFAGDTLNTAIYAARSASENIEISYVTAVGTDNFSSRMIDFFKSEQLDCQWIAQIEDKSPGLYAIDLDDKGERSFSYWRSDSAAKVAFRYGFSEQQLAALAECFDFYYLSGISLAILDDHSRAILKQVLIKARERGAKVAFDSNYRPRLWESQAKARAVTLEFLALTDIALVTFDDEQALFNDLSVSDTLSRLSDVKEVVVKQGGEGCTLIYQQQISFIPTTPVNPVIDTTSAGDSFNGGYLAKRALGESPGMAAQFAHRLAGTVIQYKGAIIPKSVTSQLLSAMDALC